MLDYIIAVLGILLVILTVLTVIVLGFMYFATIYHLFNNSTTFNDEGKTEDEQDGVGD